MGRTTPSARTRALRCARRLTAQADVVWCHIIGPDGLGFSGAGGAGGADHDDRPTIGGRVRLRDPFGDGPRDARVVAAEPARRLVVEWWTSCLQALAGAADRAGSPVAATR